MLCLIGASMVHYNAINLVEAVHQIPYFPRTMYNKVQGHLAGNPEKLSIDIKHKHFLRIAFKREQALTLGRLIVEDDDFAPAILSNHEGSFPVKIRLKGDLTDHLKTDKWSFRVKVRGDHAFSGLTTFSLQQPETRNFITEWIYHEALRREDILSLRYRFVDLTLNGKHKGIYALEEHFSKELIENNNRREGPILKFSEDLPWLRVTQFGLIGQDRRLSDSAYEASRLVPFRSRQVHGDSLMEQYYFKARSLIEAFRTKEKTVAEVFDVPRLAKYMAISELLGASHGARWRNIRFYYNPITTRIEPIGYDGHIGDEVTIPWLLLPRKTINGWMDQFQHDLLSDPDLYFAYTQALAYVVQDGYLESLLEEIHAEMKQHLLILYRDYPDYEVPLDIIYQNRESLRFLLYPAEGARAYVFEHTSDSLYLQMGATQAVPQQVNAVILQDSVHIPISPPALLEGRHESAGVQMHPVAVALPEGIQLTDSTLAQLTFSYASIGTDSIHTGNVIPYPYRVEALIDGDLTREPANIERFPFAIVDHQARRVSIPAGSWTLDQPMLLPRQYALHVAPGTSMDLTRGALILAHGPTFWNGSLEAPIRLHSSDSTGQGLVVMGADSTSRIAHTHFKNLGSASKAAWALTGAVTFHEADVAIEHSRFAHSRAEDALNIVRSAFAMDHVHFSDTASDAFDADFTTGVIQHATFTNCYNDGIDISGSQVRIEHIDITQVGDKALSAGEFSQLDAREVRISGSEIAISSKDHSTIKLSDSHIEESRVVFAIYQKKPEFGPATAEADRVTWALVDTPVLLEERSHLLLNEERIQPTHANVSELMYGTVYGRASK